MDHVKKFQRKNNLTADGIIGKNTISKMQEVWQLNDTEIAHFLGQCAHETANFRYDTENLNYSKDALIAVFGKYFTESQAEVFARQPEKIANRVYANRMGNGDECSGDGWKYRGRGAIQLTGKNNYEIFANKMQDLCILETPDIVADKYFFDVALHYFKQNDLWRYCQTVNDNAISIVTRKINGGYNGLSDRIRKTYKYYKLL